MYHSNKRLLTLIIVFSFIFLMTSVAFAAKQIVVNVACRNDYQEIWDAVNAELASDNIKVINTAYDTSVNLNDLLLAGDIELNVAQHYAYLKFSQANAPKFADLRAIGEIHIATLDLYSKKHKALNDLPSGATIAIPNDVMNGGRALLVLAKSGLITLDNKFESFPGEDNITANPKKLKFIDVASDSMVLILEDVDAGFVYSVNAVDGGLSPIKDPIFRDNIDLAKDPRQHNFIITFTARGKDADSELFKKIIKAYHSDRVYRVYKDVYKYSLIPMDNGKPVDLDKY
jgi:D-methionine transport system substrate-binding protein